MIQGAHGAELGPSQPTGRTVLSLLREEGGNPGQVPPLGSGSESLEGPRSACVCAPHGRGPRGRRVHSRDESGEARQLHDVLPITEVFIFALKI